MHAPNYLLGRDRRRLTWLVLGIGLLLLVAFRFSEIAAIARNWSHSERPIETALPTDQQVSDSVPSDAIRLQPFANLPLGIHDSDGKPPIPPATSPSIFPGLSLQLLITIQDSTLPRAAEHAAWYRIFQLLKTTPAKDLQTRATAVNSFREIYAQSPLLRGRAITLNGAARWYRTLTTEVKNEAGITEYHEVGIALTDQPSNPVLVYCLNLPPELPRGTADPASKGRFLFARPVPISVTGIYFKRLAYRATDRVREAPTLLAARIGVYPAESTDELTSGSPLQLPLILTLIGGVVCGALWWYSRGNKTVFSLGNPQPSLHNLTPSAAVADPREALQHMSEREE